MLVLLFTATLFLITLGRYVLLSVAYKVLLEKLSGTNRSSFAKKGGQIKREVKWAILSSLVFTSICAMGLLAYQAGWTAIYENIDEHSIAYFIISPVLILLVYETYYYWLHRWMHRPAVFKVVHKVHHESVTPTVFTAFSFHPVEALLQFIFFPLYVIIVPIHPIMLGLVFTVLTVCAMVNHSGVEIYKALLIKKHFIGSTHHDLHHKTFKTNYGLNFTWWDKVMKTENKKSVS
jgi:Delta7-sterol 5-desaturase